MRKRGNINFSTRLVNPGYSPFNLSKVARGTCKMGYMIPIFCRDVVPGDHFRLSTDEIVRFMPMVAPPLHQVKVYFDWFFVPNRLLWSNWEDFRTGGKDGKNASVMPYVVSPENGWATSSLFDYLCCPTGVSGIKMSALPLRAHNYIYNFYVRDENTRDELPVPMTDGLDTTEYFLYRRNWPRDYFTGALQSPQRGDPTYLPFATEAPVVGTGYPLGLTTDGSDLFGIGNGAGNGLLRGSTGIDFTYPLPTGQGIGDKNSGLAVGVSTDSVRSGLQADLTQASAITVDAARTAFQTQLIKQLLMRAGYRYREFMISFFGEDGGDARLQWPEYIGSTVSNVHFSEVLQTSATSEGTTPQANMAGHGISASSTRNLSYKSKEDGWIMGYMTVMPKASYQQGLPRQFTRWTRYDFYNPVMAHLGEQMIKNSEIMARGTDEDENGWAYMPIFEDYRRAFDSSHGEIRTTAAQWAFDRVFSDFPEFNAEFQECVPSLAPFADQDSNSDQLIYMVKTNCLAVRPIPTHGDPGFVDHYYI